MVGTAHGTHRLQLFALSCRRRIEGHSQAWWRGEKAAPFPHLRRNLAHPPASARDWAYLSGRYRHPLITKKSESCAMMP